MKGKLLVLEGPDGVGKTTLAKMLADKIDDAIYYSFPGRQGGTLGNLVYEFHHNPEKFGITEGVSQECRQLLHIVAHIDAIQRKIIPWLDEGKTVILDRYWWSTWVYGIVGGLDPNILKAIIKPERFAWGEYKPTLVVLVEVDEPRERDYDRSWEELNCQYQYTADDEKYHYPVETFENEFGLEESFAELLKIVSAWIDDPETEKYN